MSDAGIINPFPILTPGAFYTQTGKKNPGLNRIRRPILGILR